jgi:hypothetical protein
LGGMASRRLGQFEAYFSVREILPEASKAADGADWREHSDFGRLRFATLGFILSPEFLFAKAFKKTLVTAVILPELSEEVPQFSIGKHGIEVQLGFSKNLIEVNRFFFCFCLLHCFGLLLLHLFLQTVTDTCF